MRIAVIGAGPAGMTAAYKLSKEVGNKITTLDVYEAGERVGGLSKSIELWNQTVDLGPHRFFSSDPRVNKLWLEVVEKDYALVNRLTRIYYDGKFYYYPLKPLNALMNLGVLEAINCMASYYKEKLSPSFDHKDTFEAWVVSRFGKRLYEVFFKTYSEKLWGIKCSEIDSDFAAQRIKKLSIYEAVKNALLQGKGNKHKTLVDQFAYPLHGTGMVYNKMKEAITQNGGKVHLNTPVEKVITESNVAKAIQLENGNVEEYDHIISTMPISLMVSRLPGVPEKVKETALSLKFRNTILVYLNIDDKDLFPDQWLYVHSTDLEMGRITNFRNWIPTLYGEEKSSILCLEYWCNFEDDFWSKPEDEIIDLAKKELRSTGLIKDKKILDGYVHKIPRCYPIYFKGYKEKTAIVEDYLNQIQHLHVIGRYGAYKYNNQDHSILMGIMAAENLTEGKNHDLWDINNDYEYQEASVITKTGLEKKEQ